VAQFVLVCVAAALVVGALGLLGDVVRSARVPAATGVVQVTPASRSGARSLGVVAPVRRSGCVAARISN